MTDNSPFGMDVALDGLKRRGYAPETVFDIGAADGRWTQQALQVWPDSRFYCFEPLAERQAALDQLAANCIGKVHVHLVGLGDADTTLSLGVTDFLWDSSFAYSGASSRQVPVRRIATLFEEGAVPRPRFLKIDVQGFERRVIRGADELMSTVDFVLMECTFIPFCAEMTTLDDTIGFMGARGFSPYEFVDFLRRPLDGAMGQCDILFIRRDHALWADRRWSG
jgi:FkbM family methyltransferase